MVCTVEISGKMGKKEMRDGVDNPGGERLSASPLWHCITAHNAFYEIESLGSEREWSFHYTICTMPCGADLTG